MKTILITGGCGFIGSNFIRLALKSLPDATIINLDKLTYAGNLINLTGVEDNPRYRFVKGDICDATTIHSLFSQEKIDTVVHFAAESHVDRSITGPDEFIRTNITGTFTLLEAARQAWQPPENKTCRFLHVSTDEVYGSLGETGAFTEETPYDPRSPYSASKAASDHLAGALIRKPASFLPANLATHSSGLSKTVPVTTDAMPSMPQKFEKSLPGNLQ